MDYNHLAGELLQSVWAHLKSEQKNPSIWILKTQQKFANVCQSDATFRKEYGNRFVKCGITGYVMNVDVVEITYQFFFSSKFFPGDNS